MNVTRCHLALCCWTDWWPSRVSIHHPRLEPKLCHRSIHRPHICRNKMIEKNQKNNNHIKSHLSVKGSSWFATGLMIKSLMSPISNGILVFRELIFFVWFYFSITNFKLIWSDISYATYQNVLTMKILIVDNSFWTKWRTQIYIKILINNSLFWTKWRTQNLHKNINWWYSW